MQSDMPSKAELFSLDPVRWCSKCKGPVIGVAMSFTGLDADAWLCDACFKAGYNVREIVNERVARYVVGIDVSGMPLKKQLTLIEEWRQRIKSMVIR